MMWIKAGLRYYNTESLAYVQVAMDDYSKEVKAVHLHFNHENHPFTLHGEEAVAFVGALEAAARLSGSAVENSAVVRQGA